MPPEESIMLFSCKAKKSKVGHLLSSSHETATLDDGKQKRPPAILD